MWKDYSDLKEELEDKKKEIIKMIEEIMRDLASEIFGLPLAIKNDEILFPTKPNIDLIDKYFEVMRKFGGE